MSTFTLTASAIACATVFGSSVALAAEDDIVIGIPVGLSGANSVVAPAVIQVTEFAVNEINEAGGVLGRNLSIKIADDLSGAAGAQRAYDSLIYKEGADAIIAMETTAARNAGLPIITRSQTPYIYTSFYEGNSCNKYQFIDAWVPTQMVALMVDYFMEDQEAETFFLIGSDYAFGRGLIEKTDEYITEQGGTVLGSEFNPLEASDWTSIVGKVRAADPDAIIVSASIGAPNVTLTKQLRSAGIDAKYGSYSLDEGTAKTLGPDAEGIYLAGTYFTGIDTEANKTFKNAYAEKYGEDAESLSEATVPQYDAVHLYALAVEEAGTTDADAVIEALSKVKFDGPRGPIQMSEQHHSTLTMHVAQVDANGNTEVIKTSPDMHPGEQCPNL